jgi:syntaxin 18
MPFYDHTNIFKTIVKEKWAAIPQVERRKSSASRRDANQSVQGEIGKEYLVEAYKIVRIVR